MFKKQGMSQFFKKAFLKIKNVGKVPVAKADRYAELVSSARTKVMIFKKSNLPYVPHKWRGLS
jgi:hypothetical protein